MYAPTDNRPTQEFQSPNSAYITFHGFPPYLPLIEAEEYINNCFGLGRSCPLFSHPKATSLS
jgi:hypothetical protein